MHTSGYVAMVLGVVFTLALAGVLIAWLVRMNRDGACEGLIRSRWGGRPYAARPSPLRSGLKAIRSYRMKVTGSATRRCCTCAAL
jgi:hypothetical protein